MKRTLLVASLILSAALISAAQKTPESMLGAAMHQEEVQGDLKGAIAAYQKVVATRGVSRKTAAEALIHMAGCYQKMGDAESQKIYERVVKDYADQKDAVEQARTHLAASGQPDRGLALRQIGAQLGDRSYGPAVSQDGRYIAYVGQRAIFVHDLVSGAERQVIGDFSRWP